MHERDAAALAFSPAAAPHQPGWTSSLCAAYRRGMKPPVDFYFDFSSPYSYIASEWIEALAARHGRTVRWHAMLLGVTFQAAGLKSPISFPLKREYSQHDFARSARFEGVPLQMPARFPLSTQNAARVFWWLQEDDPARAAAWARAGLRAVFARGVLIDEMPALREVASACGIDADTAQAVCGEMRWKERLRLANEQAIAAGVFGAPFFIVDGEPFWGNDRRPQIERWLESGPF